MSDIIIEMDAQRVEVRKAAVSKHLKNIYTTVANWSRWQLFQNGNGSK